VVAAAVGTPAGKVRTASPKLVVEGIGCCGLGEEAESGLWRKGEVGSGEAKKELEKWGAFCSPSLGKEGERLRGEESFQPGGAAVWVVWVWLGEGRSKKWRKMRGKGGLRLRGEEKKNSGGGGRLFRLC